MNAVTSAPRVFKCVGQAFTTFVVKAFASWCIPRWLLERRLVLKRMKAARGRKQGGKKQSNCTWSKQTITQVLVRCWQKEMCYVLPSPFSFLAHVAFGRFCRPSLQCVRTITITPSGANPDWFFWFNEVFFQQVEKERQSEMSRRGERERIAELIGVGMTS